MVYRYIWYSLIMDVSVRYVTLDNGGTPFVVRILSRGGETTVTICVRKREDVDAAGPKAVGEAR